MQYVAVAVYRRFPPALLIDIQYIPHLQIVGIQVPASPSCFSYSKAHRLLLSQREVATGNENSIGDLGMWSSLVGNILSFTSVIFRLDGGLGCDHFVY